MHLCEECHIPVVLRVLAFKRHGKDRFIRFQISLPKLRSMVICREGHFHQIIQQKLTLICSQPECLSVLLSSQVFSLSEVIIHEDIQEFIETLRIDPGIFCILDILIHHVFRQIKSIQGLLFLFQAVQLLYLHDFVICHLLDLHLTFFVRQLRIKHNLENLVTDITKDFRTVTDTGFKNADL